LKITVKLKKMSEKLIKSCVKQIILYLVMLIINKCNVVISQDANIVLKQGTVVGVSFKYIFIKKN